MEPQANKQKITNTVEGFVKTAYQLIEEKKLVEAREILQQLLDKVPNQPNCLFGLALIYYQSHNWAEAKRILHRLIDKFPNSALAIEYLALMLFEENHLEEAEFYLKKVLEIEPTNAVYQRNLGYLYQRKREHQLAKKYFLNAIALKPEYAECHNFLGYLAEIENEQQEAISYYQKALSINANYTEALIGLGLIFIQQDKQQGKNFLDRAVQGMKAYEELCKELPVEQPNSFFSYAELFIKLGIINKNEKKWFLAQRCFEAAEHLHPDQALTWYQLGQLNRDQNNTDQAIQCFKQAMDLDNSFDEAKLQLANTLVMRHQYAKAGDLYREIIKKNPGNFIALTNLATVEDKQGKYQLALEGYHQVLSHYDKNDYTFDEVSKFNYATTRFNLSLIQLRNRNYKEGWPNYQFRKSIRPSVYYDNIKKLTDITHLVNEKIIILNDQGLGDLVQFIRFAHLLKRGGAHVEVSASTEITPLLKSCPYVDEARDYFSLSDLAAYQQVLVSDLPFLFKIDETHLLADQPYLFTDTDKQHEVDTYLVSSKKLKVGICHQGKRGYEEDYRRSLKLKHFSSIFNLEDIDFYSLSIHYPECPLSEYQNFIQDLSEHLQDFSDLAGIISRLDLVITVDTAVAHVAGAMHAPCWVLLPSVSDWRWQLNREDSPWYPSLRLFRQTDPSNWDGVIQQVKHNLIQRRNHV